MAIFPAYVVLPVDPAVLETMLPAGEAMARAKLLTVNGKLAEIEADLAVLRASFPVTTPVLAEGDEEDFSTELSVRLENWIYDSLQPLRREIQRMAQFGRTTEKEGKEG